MNIKPLADRVALKQLDAEEVSKGGIILHSKAMTKPPIADVIAVGEEATLKIGDRVLLSQHLINPIIIGGEEYLIVSQSSILAVLEENGLEGK